MTDTMRLGISACLLGQAVRYDGGHKRDAFLVDTLGRFVEYVPVCPEVECGLGVPRESMRLVGDPEAPRLVTRETKTDHTDRMLAWAERRVRELEKENLCGFVFKAKSPSSGMERVKVYTEKGAPAGMSVGLFARAFRRHFPLLPVEEEGRLNDPDLRENFIERLFALHRYRAALAGGRSVAALMRFHEHHKLLVMSHSPQLAREMGRLLADGKRRVFGELAGDYEVLFVKALSLLATPGKHANVLQHMMGYLRDDLDADEKQELADAIEDYRRGLTPLVVPIVLLRHYVRKYRTEYLRDQVYLTPHPAELKLRNHA